MDALGTDAPKYAGTDDELDALVEEAWISGSPSGVLDLSQVFAWRDAAVARFLAEAGAVHPAVHTPARVMQWLEQHGWERYNVSDIAVAWRHQLSNGSFMNVYMPTNPDAIDYARRVHNVLQDGTLYDGTPLSQVLAEVAVLPDEWAW